MKKNVLLFMIIALIIMLFIPNINYGASHSVSTSSNAVTEGETINVTVSVNAAQWNLTLTANGTSIGTWTETVNYKENLSKSFTVSYKAKEKGNVRFVLTGDYTDVDQTTTEVNETKSVTVNGKVEENNSGNTSTENNNTTTGGNTSSGNSNMNTESNNTGSNSGSSNTTGGNTSGGNTNSNTTTDNKPQVEKLSFSSKNETVYATSTVNVRQSYSTSSDIVGSLEKGKSVTRTGIATKSVGGILWSKVNFNGQTAYISSSYLTTEEPKEEEEETNSKALTSLTIKGVELEPKFDKETTQYTATVSEDITKLDITAKAEDKKAKVQITGNDDIKLGSNIVRIKVTAQDDTVRTYMINVTKQENKDSEEPEETLENTDLQPEQQGLFIERLEIKDVNFEQGFNPQTFMYELTLNDNTISSLNLNVVPNKEDAIVEIIGNENFSIGTNIITILLTSADGLETVTYQIKVTLPEEVEKATLPVDSKTIYIAIAVLGSLIVITIILLITYRGKSGDDEEEEFEQIVEELPTPTKKEENTKRSKGKRFM